jgi:biotin carboxyl carrier protein
MKLEVVVDGRAAALNLENNRFTYASEGQDAISREFSVEPVIAGTFSVLIGERSYDVVASGGDIRVNGRSFKVEVFDPREMRGRKSAGAGEGRQNIAAMMPGKVVRVLVEQGDSVEAGQGLIVVEAMKMQNEMKSPKAGRVIEIKTRADATVAAGEVLMVIE